MISSLTKTIQRQFDSAFADLHWNRRRIDYYEFQRRGAHLSLIHEKVRGLNVVKTNPILGVPNAEIEATYKLVTGEPASGPAAFACNIGYLSLGKYKTWSFTEGGYAEEIEILMADIRRVIVPIAKLTSNTLGLCKFISDTYDRQGTNHAGPLMVGIAKHLFGGPTAVQEFYHQITARSKFLGQGGLSTNMLLFFDQYRNYVGHDRFNP